jgi:hypothetical protein
VRCCAVAATARSTAPRRHKSTRTAPTGPPPPTAPTRRARTTGRPRRAATWWREPGGAGGHARALRCMRLPPPPRNEALDKRNEAHTSVHRAAARILCVRLPARAPGGTRVMTKCKRDVTIKSALARPHAWCGGLPPGRGGPRSLFCVIHALFSVRMHGVLARCCPSLPPARPRLPLILSQRARVPREAPVDHLRLCRTAASASTAPLTGLGLRLPRQRRAWRGAPPAPFCRCRGRRGGASSAWAPAAEAGPPAARRRARRLQAEVAALPALRRGEHAVSRGDAAASRQRTLETGTAPAKPRVGRAASASAGRMGARPTSCPAEPTANTVHDCAAQRELRRAAGARRQARRQKARSCQTSHAGLSGGARGGKWCRNKGTSFTRESGACLHGCSCLSPLQQRSCILRLLTRALP